MYNVTNYLFQDANIFKDPDQIDTLPDVLNGKWRAANAVRLFHLGGVTLRYTFWLKINSH